MNAVCGLNTRGQIAQFRIESVDRGIGIAPKRPDNIRETAVARAKPRSVTAHDGDGAI